MSNINAFWPVVHEKIFEELSKLSLFRPSLGQPQACFLPSLVEIGPVLMLDGRTGNWCCTMAKALMAFGQVS